MVASVAPLGAKFATEDWNEVRQMKNPDIPWANEVSAVDGGIPFLSTIGRARPAATDPHC